MKRVAKHLKNYLVPHEGNEDRPHLLRLRTAMTVIGGVLLLEIIFLAAPLAVFRYTDFFADVLSTVLVDATNTQRLSNSVGTLTINPTLVVAAQAKANDMAAKGYFAHVTPEGHTPWYWLDNAKYSFAYAGENLAVNFFDSQDVANAWMNSPTHRANLLNDKFTEIGIATARGQYEGRESVFVVQFFGRPALASTAPIVSAPLPAKSAFPEIISEPTVAGAETSDLAQSFVETETPAAPKPEQTPEQVAESVRNSTELQKFLVSPRSDTNSIYLVLLTLVVFAICLKLFVRFNPNHSDLLVNGAVMLIIIASALTLNYYISAGNGAVS